MDKPWDIQITTAQPPGKLLIISSPPPDGQGLLYICTALSYTYSFQSSIHLLKGTTKMALDDLILPLKNVPVLVSSTHSSTDLVPSCSWREEAEGEGHPSASEPTEAASHRAPPPDGEGTPSHTAEAGTQDGPNHLPPARWRSGRRVSSPEAAKEVLKTLDVHCCNRPSSPGNLSIILYTFSPRLLLPHKQVSRHAWFCSRTSNIQVQSK